MYSHTLRGLIYYVNGSYPSLCWGCTGYKLIRLEKHPRHDLQPPTKPRQRRLTVQSIAVCNAERVHMHYTGCFLRQRSRKATLCIMCWRQR
jgi:hypothetical protein